MLSRLNICEIKTFCKNKYPNSTLIDIRKYALVYSASFHITEIQRVEAESSENGKRGDESVGIFIKGNKIFE